MAFCEVTGWRDWVGRGRGGCGVAGVGHGRGGRSGWWIRVVMTEFFFVYGGG